METKETETMTRKIEIEVPEGKAVKWIDGVLTLVDEEVKDTRPVTDRIKTFHDAAKAVGIEDPAEWEESYSNVEPDILAYFKLRIICKALNDGWEPKFTEDEYRYYPYFYLYTKEEIDEMIEKERNSGVLFGGNANNGANAGFVFACSADVPSRPTAYIGSRLCLKNSDLATYCGKQFIDIWADFCLIRNKDIEL